MKNQCYGTGTDVSHVEILFSCAIVLLSYEAVDSAVYIYTIDTMRLYLPNLFYEYAFERALIFNERGWTPDYPVLDAVSVEDRTK